MFSLLNCIVYHSVKHAARFVVLLFDFLFTPIVLCMNDEEKQISTLLLTLVIATSNIVKKFYSNCTLNDQR